MQKCQSRFVLLVSWSKHLNNISNLLDYIKFYFSLVFRSSVIRGVIHHKTYPKIIKTNTVITTTTISIVL